jgi:hypothetical protein
MYIVVLIWSVCLVLWLDSASILGFGSDIQKPTLWNFYYQVSKPRLQPWSPLIIGLYILEELRT